MSRPYEQTVELNKRVCIALGLDPNRTLSVSVHFAPGELLTVDFKQLVRPEQAEGVVRAIEQYGAAEEAVR